LTSLTGCGACLCSAVALTFGVTLGAEAAPVEREGAVLTIGTGDVIPITMALAASVPPALGADAIPFSLASFARPASTTSATTGAATAITANPATSFHVRGHRRSASAAPARFVTGRSSASAAPVADPIAFGTAALSIAALSAPAQGLGVLTPAFASPPSFSPSSCVG
jgi:hypothetical protein